MFLLQKANRMSLLRLLWNIPFSKDDGLERLLLNLVQGFLYHYGFVNDTRLVFQLFRHRIIDDEKYWLFFKQQKSSRIQQYLPEIWYASLNETRK